jgi:hypothetical protein
LQDQNALFQGFQVHPNWSKFTPKRTIFSSPHKFHTSLHIHNPEGLFWQAPKPKSSQKHDKSSQSGLRQRRFRAEGSKPPPEPSQVHLKRTICSSSHKFHTNEHYFLKSAQVSHKVTHTLCCCFLSIGPKFTQNESFSYVRTSLTIELHTLRVAVLAPQ